MDDRLIVNRTRRQLMLAAAGSMLLGTAASGFAQANGLTGPIKIVVPFTPGTTPDSVARLIGPKLSKRLGQPVVVDNRPGASGIVGMDLTAKAPPDGHTIMVTTNTTLTLPYFYKKVPFNVIQSFQPLCMIGSNNFALVAHPSVPATSVKELVAYLKSNPDDINYASPGNGTLHHLAMEKIASTMGVRINHIPYKGTAGAITDVIGGHVKLMIMPLHLAAGFQNSGKLKIIGSTRAQRDPLFPNVTPLQEGGIPNFDEDAWVAVWGPAGMSAGMVALYNSAIKEALEGPESQAAMAQQGLTLHPGSPEDMKKIALAEYEKWGGVVRAAKIQAE